MFRLNRRHKKKNEWRNAPPSSSLSFESAAFSASSRRSSFFSLNKKKPTLFPSTEPPPLANDDDDNEADTGIPWDLLEETGTAEWRVPSDIPLLPEGERSWHAAVALRDGSVVVAGGCDGQFNRTKTVWIWNPSYSTSWTAGPSMTEKRFGLALVVCGTKLYAVGGHNGRRLLDTVECLDLELLAASSSEEEEEETQSVWTTLSCPLSSAREGCAAVAVLDRYLVILGGHNGSERLNTVDILDTHNKTVQPAVSCMTVARYWFGAAVVDNNTIFAFGGEASGGGSQLSTVECWNIVKNNAEDTANNSSDSPLDIEAKWRTVDALFLSTGRNAFGLAVVGSCLVLAGGRDAETKKDLTSVEVANVSKGTVWPLSAEMNEPRYGCAAVVLQDGRLAVLGGRGLDSVETLQLVVGSQHDS